VTEAHLCPFARALLKGQIRCQQAQSYHVAERHGIQCNNPEQQLFCLGFSDHLHAKSRFALGVTHLPQQRTSNMELKVQCGGINGLLEALNTQLTPANNDLQQLLEQAREQFNGIDQLPYQQIIQSMSQWQPKRRGKRGKG